VIKRQVPERRRAIVLAPPGERGPMIRAELLAASTLSKQEIAQAVDGLR
jgi:hypothetical protein